MDSLLHTFPRPAMIVDGSLEVVDCSRRCLAVFGVRALGQADSWAASLTQSLVQEQDLGDDLALATARLTQPGEEETITWSRDGRRWEVTIAAMEGAGATGIVERFLVLFSDVTHQRLAEEIQLNARHYLEHILSDIPIGVTVLNEELRVTSANRWMLAFLRRMGGRGDLVEAIGAAVTELVPGEVGAEWQALGRQVLERGEAASDGRRAFESEAGELVLATEMTPLRDHRGALTGVIVMATDVSEQTRLERELIRVEKLATVGQMVITVNHEINNPLTIIAANAQSMRLLNKDMDERTLKKLERIEKQVKRISEVTERLRTMDEVTSSEYIEAGPDMIDVWRGCEGDSED